ncbi:MAG: SH3 domain-containing protein [Anaerolineales bacterium]|nr:SH3 domain-containing protein [Anaerolineales bacterium]
MKKIIILLLVLPFLACTLTNTSKPALDDATLQTLKRPQVFKTDEVAITCTVTAFQTLNVREAPTMQSAVIAVLKHGEIVNILPDDIEKVWLKIQTQNVTGWIHSNYCERN